MDYRYDPLIKTLMTESIKVDFHNERLLSPPLSSMFIWLSFDFSISKRYYRPQLS